MFTKATKNFGVWKEDRKTSKISYYLASSQFLYALSIAAFIVFITLIVVVKIRQEFFLIESAPVILFKNKSLNKDFFIKERASAITLFIKKEKNKQLGIYFENGQNFLLPGQANIFVPYMEKRKRNIIYMAMVMRLNTEQNSRIKIWTHKNISFEDIKFVTKLFSMYGFDSFDIGVER